MGRNCRNQRLANCISHRDVPQPHWSVLEDEQLAFAKAPSPKNLQRYQRQTSRFGNPPAHRYRIEEDGISPRVLRHLQLVNSLLTDRALEALRIMNQVMIGDPVTERTRSRIVEFVVEADTFNRHSTCQICELAAQLKTNPRQLQQHHVAGKVRGEPNYPDSITVCTSCHESLSDIQRSWLISRTDPATRLSCYFFGLADIFTLLAQKSGKKFFRKLASQFRAKGHYIRNRVQKGKA